MPTARATAEPFRRRLPTCKCRYFARCEFWVSVSEERGARLASRVAAERAHGAEMEPVLRREDVGFRRYERADEIATERQTLALRESSRVGRYAGPVLRPYRSMSGVTFTRTSGSSSCTAAARLDSAGGKLVSRLRRTSSEMPKLPATRRTCSGGRAPELGDGSDVRLVELFCGELAERIRAQVGLGDGRPEIVVAAGLKLEI